MIRDEVVKLYSVDQVYQIWPFVDGLDDALEQYRHVSNALANSDETIIGWWDEGFAGMANVVLEERAQARSEDIANRKT